MEASTNGLVSLAIKGKRKAVTISEDNTIQGESKVLHFLVLERPKNMCRLWERIPKRRRAKDTKVKK